MRPAVIVSACLLGDSCRYDGASKRNAAVCALVHEIEASGSTVERVCPELSAGLPCPRPVAELQPDGSVTTAEGCDVTKEFVAGAAQCLRRALDLGARVAILKDGSPSCGSHFVYDGSFSGERIEGQGLLAKSLVGAGIQVFSERDVERAISLFKELTES